MNPWLGLAIGYLISMGILIAFFHSAFQAPDPLEESPAPPADPRAAGEYAAGTGRSPHPQHG